MCRQSDVHAIGVEAPGSWPAQRALHEDVAQKAFPRRFQARALASSVVCELLMSPSLEVSKVCCGSPRQCADQLVGEVAYKLARRANLAHLL